MTTQGIRKREVHLLQLVGTLRALHHAMHSGSTTVQLASRPLGVQCMQCGITLTEDELDWLEHCDNSAASPSNPRLQRIMQGYCARRSCDSYFYEVTLPAEGEFDPASLWKTAAESIHEPISRQTVRGPTLVDAITSRYSKRELLVAVTVITTLSFVLWWQFRTPSWASRPSGYLPDPSSLEVLFQP